jgi:hypothetical protein
MCGRAFQHWVCCSSLAGIVASNPARVMDVCLFWVLCFIRQRSLRRADHSSRGVLPTVERRCVCGLETSRMKRPWSGLGRSAEVNTYTIWKINVCVCRFEGVALLFIALVTVVCCSMQCRSNGCKKEGTFCLRVSLVERHYSLQKIIIIYLNSMWRTNINNPVFMKIN